MKKEQPEVKIEAKKELKELNKLFGQELVGVFGQKNKGGGRLVRFEVVRYELIKRACRRQERTNLNFKAKSLVWSSMLDCVFGEFCEEVRLDEGTALMRLGWREFIKTL